MKAAVKITKPASAREPWNFLILVSSAKGLILRAKKRSLSPNKPNFFIFDIKYIKGENEFLTSIINIQSEQSVS